MDERSELFSTESASNFLKKNIILVILVLGGLLMVVVGGLQFFSKPETAEIEFVASEKSPEAEKIFVEISGAVKNGGVFEFSSDERISHAIEAAGGLSDDADSEFVAKNINQAQFLTDGMKIYIPREGEEVESQVLGSSDSTNAGGLINLNSASQSELEELPGIGPSRAEDIISGRPYESVDELLVKKVVGSSVFEDIKDLVTAP